MSRGVISFVLLCEGSSDQDLVVHLQEMLIKHGADEAIGTPDFRPGSVERKLRRLLEEGSSFNMVFVHRDADGRDHRPRLIEVEGGAHNAHFPFCIPVVPVQATEAWLLTDEQQIRNVAGRPNGRANLSVPTLRNIESTTDPKRVLREALATASEAKGRRLDRERRAFNARRRTLLQRLDVTGDVTHLPSWQRLDEAVKDAVGELLRG